MIARAIVILVLALGATAGARGLEMHAAVGGDPDPKGRLAGAPLRDGGANAVSVLGNPLSNPLGNPLRNRLANPLWMAPLQGLSATRERPLFSASRRPPAPATVAVALPPPPVAAPPPQLPSRPPLVLIGTLLGESLRIGIFHDEATTRTLRLAVGGNHDGWHLRALGTAEARFENGDRAATLELRRSSVQATPQASSDLDWPIAPVRRRKR